MAVAEQGYLLGGEILIKVTVVDNNEIVAGAVHLGKGEGHKRVIVLIVKRCKRLASRMGRLDERGDKVLQYSCNLRVVGVFLDGFNYG